MVCVFKDRKGFKFNRMKRKNGAALILILSALLSACGTRTSVPEHEKAATLADLKDGNTDKPAPTPAEAPIHIF